MPRDLIASELEQLIARHGADDSGSVADYIPELSKADPSWFGVSVCTIDGAVYDAGDHQQPFTIQSVSKPFVYALALTDVGPDRLLEQVGVEPSGDAFNSILLDSSNRPHNPMVNSGAITVVSMVAARSAEGRFARILDLLSRFAGRRLDVDEAVFDSERETGHRNRAIAHLMRTVGALTDDVDVVLDAYFRQCSVLVTGRDLAVMTATLANDGVNPVTGERVVPAWVVGDVLSVMLTSGMYNYSGEWAYRTGLPAKSGVAGGVAALVPGQAGVGVFSPLLDERGNSVRGVKVCRELSDRLGFHLFRNRTAGLPPIRSVSSGMERRSLRVRPMSEVAALDSLGCRIAIVEMQGPWSFVACERLFAQLESVTHDHLILDTSRVATVDTTATVLLGNLVDSCRHRGVEVAVSGAVPAGLDSLPARYFPSLDHALEWAEGLLLTRAGMTGTGDAVSLPDSDLGRQLDAADLAALSGDASIRWVEAGDELWCTGEEAGSMFLVLEGMLVASHAGFRVASFGPGAIVGEMGFLTGEPRSATVVADAPSRLLEVTDLDGLSNEGRAAIHRTLAIVTMGRLTVTNRALAAART
jgi:glutaminase